jgi:UTP--glucose-1-phosphate uridylyltransferase
MAGSTAGSTKFVTWWKSLSWKKRPETLAETKVGVGGELQLTDGMRALLKKEKMYGYVFEGKRHDAGDKLGFLKATIEFALKRKDLGGPLREYLKALEL